MVPGFGRYKPISSRTLQNRFRYCGDAMRAIDYSPVFPEYSIRMAARLGWTSVAFDCVTISINVALRNRQRAYLSPAVDEETLSGIYASRRV